MSTTIWLLPKADSGLDVAVRRYAAAQGKSSFSAHLTLASTPRAAVPDLEPLAAYAPVVLERDGVLETTHFTRAFALKYAATPALFALVDAARRMLGPGDLGDPLPFIPHVSLTYGPFEDRAPLDALALAFQAPLAFDRICLVSGAGSATQADVAGWRIDAERSLRGEPR